MAMKVAIVLLFIVSFTYGKSLSSDNFDYTSDDLIDYVNSLNTTWKAGKIFNDQLMNQGGSLMAPEDLIKSKSNLVNNQDVEIDFPEHFDAREVWPNCDSIATIRDQGGCAACWAVNTVSVMSDRLCIKSNGTINVQLSAEEVISCCEDCNLGCGKGGYVTKSFSYWIKHGIVTGGSYHGDGCYPYEIKPCYKSKTGKIACEKTTQTPECRNECASGYNKNFTQDKYFGEKFDNLWGMKSIMLDIMTNGPVVAQIKQYRDLRSYQSGIYQHETGEMLGYHSVKLIGWGNDQGVDYWLVANSWGTYWGEKGFFKIKRGHNEADVEHNVFTGLPKL
ncbi:cathepsin B-like cysteine proteinase 3 [Panonychus citri]|uniref:cathepsin B-like cysteine proteinase 3 n=1 Tax=Panonychus citri TaxID=50023 RepID=UPI0023075822|nr:cathepsin B-like cysteine proteinase 3 [Panonychus citri]